MTTETGTLTSQYHRQLIAAGISDRREALTIAAAIARFETQYIPPNALQKQVIKQWESVVRRLDLWRIEFN